MRSPFRHALLLIKFDEEVKIKYFWYEWVDILILSLLFHLFQIKEYGYDFDFDLHKKWLLWSIAVVCSATYALIVLSFFIFNSISAQMDWTSIPTFAAYTIICGSHVTIFVVYIFLLVNVQIRFRQLNKFIRYKFETFFDLVHFNSYILLPIFFSAMLFRLKQLHNCSWIASSWNVFTKRITWSINMHGFTINSLTLRNWSTNAIPFKLWLTWLHVLHIQL